MKQRYLHLSAYPCDTCAGPVIAGSTAVRENEISRETDIQRVGPPICLSCGHRQERATAPAHVHHLLPIAWGPVHMADDHLPMAVFVHALDRTELH